MSKPRAKIYRRMLWGERSLGRGIPKTQHVKNRSSKKDWENNSLTNNRERWYPELKTDLNWPIKGDPQVQGRTNDK